MIDTLLEKKLKGLKKGVILVVMDDQMVFGGKLVDFDKSTLILRDVHQGSAADIDWKRLGKKSSEEEEKEYGFIEWKPVNLNEVYIRVDHISRIWPWKPRSEGWSPSDKIQSGSKYVEHPLYLNRTSGVDIPESIREI